MKPAKSTSATSILGSVSKQHFAATTTDCLSRFTSSNTERIASCKRAGVALSQRRQRDKLPLLAPLIAAEQPTVDAVIEARQQSWPKWQQEKRDQRAAACRDARRSLQAYSLITRHAIRRLWDDAPFPGDPSYFSDFLRQIESGKVDPFCRAPWRPSDDEIAEGRRRLAIFALRIEGHGAAPSSKPATTSPLSGGATPKIRSFGLLTAGDGG
jgi:hypothetical protein